MQTLAVEIAPADASASLRQALLDVCTRAARSAVCIEATTDRSSDSDWVAVVSWKDATHVRVEVSLRADPKWAIREVSFEARDPVEERWRAVGLVIGTLAGASPEPAATPPAEAPASANLPDTGEGAPPAPPETAPAPKPSEEPPQKPAEVAAPKNSTPSNPAVSVAREPPRWFIDAAPILGSALIDGPVRLGAELGVRARVASSGLDLGLGGAYSTGAGRWHGLHTTWTEAFGGLSYERALSRTFASNVHAEGLVERFEAELASGTPKSGSRVLGGARVGADLFCWVTDAFGVFAGGSGRWVAGTTDVAIGGNATGTAPSFGYVVRVGVSFGVR